MKNHVIWGLVCIPERPGESSSVRRFGIVGVLKELSARGYPFWISADLIIQVEKYVGKDHYGITKARREGNCNDEKESYKPWGGPTAIAKPFFPTIGVGVFPLWNLARPPRVVPDYPRKRSHGPGFCDLKGAENNPTVIPNLTQE